MLNRTFTRAALLTVVVFAFCFGLWKLLELRFQTSDFYPQYSSLRTDPLGAKALYESLAKLKGIACQRHFEATSRLTGAPASTIVFAGVNYSFFIDDPAQDWEMLARAGARVVITFNPGVSIFNSPPPPPKTKTPPKPGKKPKPIEPHALASLGLHVERNPPASLKRWQAKKTEDAAENLPSIVSWLSPLYFKTGETNGWETIYTVSTNSVVIERSFGKGSLVLCSDSYFLSNEGLHDERHPPLLLWLMGSNKKIVFDEAHLGVQHGTGIAVLAREYRLHGFFISILLLVGIYIWQNSTSFVPPLESEAEQSNELIAPKSSREGFTELLERNIPSSKILSACFDEWKKVRLPGRRDLAAKVTEIEVAIIKETNLPPSEQNPVATYKEITAMLRHK